MELRDFPEILSLIGFLLLFAGAGAAGYFFGRYQGADNRRSTKESSRSRRPMKHSIQ